MGLLQDAVSDMQQQTAAVLVGAAREAAQAALPRSRVSSRSNLGGAGGSSAASSYSSVQAATNNPSHCQPDGASPTSQVAPVPCTPLLSI